MRDLQEKTEAKNFLNASFLFVIPFVIVLGVPFAVLYSSGELEPIETVIQKQQGDVEITYGPAYSDITPYYKLHAVEAHSPKILALGASTVMQFSSRLFVEPKNFFNAGGAIGSMTDFKEFIDLLPEGKKPKVILIGLPLLYFKSNAPQNVTEQPLKTLIPAEEKFFTKWSVVWQDLFKRKISLDSFFASAEVNAIGLQAIMKRDGFLNDGSYTWGSYVSEERSGFLEKKQTERHRVQLAEFEAKTASGYRNGGMEPDEIAIRQLEDFLVSARGQGLYIIGFLPPSFSHEIYTRLKRPEYNAQYLFKLESRIKPLFAAYGYPFFNFSDLESFGSSDAELYDLNHATRKAYARMLVVMAQSDPVLKREVDVDFLKEKIRVSSSSLDIF